MSSYTGVFASDNNSGAHPKVMEAIGQVNEGLVKSYGEDQWTEEAIAALRNTFGKQASPWFVFTGTAANVLGIKSLVRSHHGIICADLAHINTDECGAPEALIGSKLLPVPHLNGKLWVEGCSAYLEHRQSVHSSYPKVLSVTQLTEFGTAYSVDELLQIGKFCKDNDLYFHMDGARLANAAAHLGVSLRAISTDVGVDVLSFGGTKNGLLYGEAVVFLNEKIKADFGHVRKQHLQLGSKMRYVSAQFLAYLQDDLWLANATRANELAQVLAQGIGELPWVRIENTVEGNALFVRMPQRIIEALQKEFYFYTISTQPAVDLPPDWHLVRLMTSFTTQKADVDTFVNAIAAFSA